MSKINMSDFLQTTKMVIKDGEAVIEKPKINGEVSINEFNVELAEKIQKEVMDKITNEELTNDEYFTYKIFPYIANINMDITFEQFQLLMKKRKRPFTLLLDMVIGEMNEMFEAAKDITNMNEKAKTFQEINQDLFIEKKISKEQREDELLEELSKCYHDKEKRDKILMELNELREGV